MAARVVPTTDVTGKKSAALAKQHREEQAKRAQEMSLTHQAEQESISSEIIDVSVTPEAPTIIDDVVDVSGDDYDYSVDLLAEAAALGDPAPQGRSSAVDMGFLQQAPQIVDETVEYVGIEDDTRVVRVAEDLEQVTIGEKNYDFVAGRKYKVPKNVADVLGWAGKLYDRV